MDVGEGVGLRGWEGIELAPAGVLVCEQYLLLTQLSCVKMVGAMIEASQKTADLRYELCAEGFRMTKLRIALLEIFARDMKPFSADEILPLLRKNHIPVHKVSLYRHLELLVNAGVLRPIFFHDQVKRYEFVEHKHHHHVVCTSCGKVAEIEVADDFDAAERKIEKQTKFSNLFHSLEFFGLCQTCSRA